MERRTSIRNRLVGLIALAAIVPLAIGFTIVTVANLRAFKRELIENTVLIARVTAEHSVADLAFGDREAGEKTLAKLASMPNVRRAFLFDGGGKLFAAHPPDAKAGPLPASHPVLRQIGDTTLSVSEPVAYSGERYGTILLEVSTEALQTKVRNHLAAISIVMIVIIALAVALALLIERVVSRPILHLADLARGISRRHDYSVRVPVTTEDEVGQLAEAFNQMLMQIGRRERERDEADQRTREKSQFLANMSHELRTPLNAIIGFSEILKNRLAGQVADREQRFLENINTSGHHLLGLVNDILDLSKIEAGRMEVVPETVAVHGAIDAVCNLMRGVSSQRRISIDVELDEHLPDIEADTVKVKQVLYNLLSNAVKFSPEGSTVTIRAKRRRASEPPLYADAVSISIADRGVGIDPKDHRRIFLEFQQIDNQATRQFGGTGLGLALVKKFMEMHAGSVELASELGKGSIFTVTFPRLFRGEGASRETSPEDLERAGRLRVLVIEDDEAAFRAVEQQLRAAGYAPVHARSGEEGISLARELMPVAITLDLVLPGIDGIEVLQRLKNDPGTRGIPVIIISVIDNRELGLAFGAKDYLVKPVDPDRLLVALRAILQPAGDGAKLLVIDDDRELHAMLDARLRPHGYSLLHAYGTSDGVARASAESPSLVILDLMMEEMDGFEVAARLKADPRTARLPILAVTHNSLNGHERRRLQGKIHALVERGDLSGSRLVSVIEDLLQRP